jgi:hypothetical protein
MKTVGIEDWARQNSGEPVTTGTDPRSVAGALAALHTLKTQELRDEWCKLHGAEPPKRLSRDLLLRAIAHQIQQRVHGALSLVTKRRLAALTVELEARGAARFDPGAILKPGTRLVREWHGRTHSVVVLENGAFEYQGQRYRSLTRIAGLITGVHWSGPVFFGLKKRPNAPAAAGG